MLVLILSGCASNQNSLNADLLGTNALDTGEGLTRLNGQSNHQPPQILQSMPGQKPLYDEAYDKAKTYFPRENPVRGAILGANLKNKEEIAGFFQSLVQNQHYSTIVVLESANIDPNIDQGQTDNFPPSAAVGNDAYKTPFGLLSPPEDVLQKAAAAQIFANDATTAKVAEREAWPGIVAPFVARSFPDATFLPVFISSDATAADDEKLAEWLTVSLPEDTLVIAQTVPKTSVDPTIADFQLKFTEDVLENFDSSKYDTLPLNDTVSVDVLERYLFKRKAQRFINQFMDPQTGSFIDLSMDGSVVQTRSAFVVAFGDFMFDRLVRSLMDSHSMDYPFENMDLTYMKSNDILVANLEGPIAKKRALTSKSIAFRFNPDIVPLLKKYFFDALSQANNHAMDMGVSGFNDTFDLLAPTGIQAFGDPRQIDDRSVATFDVQGQSSGGQKIVFLGLEEVVYKIDDAKAVAKIKELTAQGYKVIPFMHWGIEYQHKPNARQQQLAHEFIDAGAVAVIGCHPHVVETFETYKNRPIFYSLGNAVFDQYFSPDTQEGLSTAIIVSNDQLQIYFLPVKIDHSQIRMMNPDERAAFLQRFVTYGDYESEAERQDILHGKLTINLS